MIYDYLKDVFYGQQEMDGGKPSTGLIGQGGQYGGGAVQGILSSPDVIQGIGLLSQGMRGVDVSTALSETNKVRSQQVALVEAKKKQDFIKKYSSQVPESERALFEAFPEQYIKNKSLIAKPELVNIQVPGDKTPRTLDLNNPQQKAIFDDLTLNKGAFQVGKPTVQATDIGGISGLSKAASSEAEKKIISGTELLDTLNRMESYYDPKFLEFKGKAEKEITETLDKLGMANPEQIKFIQRYNRWNQANEQYFNSYRKLITGVAAGEKEIGWLQSSIPSSKDAPRVYEAKVALQKDIQQKIIDNANAFRKLGLGAVQGSNGEITPEFKKYLQEQKLVPSKQSLQPVFDSYIEMGYDAKQIKKIMNIEYKGIDWENILLQ